MARRVSPLRAEKEEIIPVINRAEISSGITIQIILVRIFTVAPELLLNWRYYFITTIGFPRSHLYT
jgi:hypothetical protein